METAQYAEANKTAKENPASADRVSITYYTDPLCCWSWALEPHWEKLRRAFGPNIRWKYVMSGMIQDWKSYNDPMNAISRPAQFGPVWMHASQMSGSEIDYSIWYKDPPASSYPSCIAVKCAALQSAEAAERLLRRLRIAVMTQGLNIARESVILELAQQLSTTNPETFTYDKFQTAWTGGAGVEAFRDDLQQTRFLKIGRYPTLTFTNGEARGIMITGYRPYDVLKDALGQMLK